jgi:arsenite methyltransferase
MEKDIRAKVEEHYGEIAANVSKESKSCCCSNKSCCGDESISNTNTIYKEENLNDLPFEAINASLGCANPFVFAELKKGETVLDLGSGGGIDVLTASKYVGDTGRIYGLDMTDEMLKLANKNKEKMGVANVDFIKGYIEDIPLKDNMIDAIISNCVINLSADKEKVISEAYRVLKPGGRLAIADIVSIREIPGDLKNNEELWCGCVSGALSVEEYKKILEKEGFKNISIEPVHIYTKSVIMQEILDNESKDKYDESLLDSLDGAFAGSQIKAWK